MRTRAIGDGSVLLPVGRESIPRPWLLRGAEAAVRRSGRFRASLRACSRARTSRATPARHGREGATAAGIESLRGKPALGSVGTASRLLRRRVGALHRTAADAPAW